MAQTAITNRSKTGDTIASGDSKMLTLVSPVQMIDFFCDTGSATSLKVTVRNVKSPHIHENGDPCVIPASGSRTFEADKSNRISTVLLEPNTPATVTYSYSTRKS